MCRVKFTIAISIFSIMTTILQPFAHASEFQNCYITFIPYGKCGLKVRNICGRELHFRILKRTGDTETEVCYKFTSHQERSDYSSRCFDYWVNVVSVSATREECAHDNDEEVWNNICKILNSC